MTPTSPSSHPDALSPSSSSSSSSPSHSDNSDSDSDTTYDAPSSSSSSSSSSLSSAHTTSASYLVSTRTPYTHTVSFPTASTNPTDTDTDATTTTATTTTDTDTTSTSSSPHPPSASPSPPSATSPSETSPTPSSDTYSSTTDSNPFVITASQHPYKQHPLPTAPSLFPSPSLASLTSSSSSTRLSSSITPSAKHHTYTHEQQQWRSSSPLPVTPRLPPSVVTHAAAVALKKTTEDDEYVEKNHSHDAASDEEEKKKLMMKDLHEDVDDDSDIIFKSDGYGSTVISAVFNHNSQNNNNTSNIRRSHIALSFDSSTTSDTSSSSDDDGHRHHHIHLHHPFPHRSHKTITRSVSPSSPEKPSPLDLIRATDDDIIHTPPSSIDSTKHDQVFIDTEQPQKQQPAKCKPFVMHPPSSTPEPFRDIAGPVTLYRVILVLWTLSIVGSLFTLQDWIWPPDPNGSPFIDKWYARTSVGCILLVPLLSCLLAFIGAFWFRFDESLDSVPPMRHKVVFRIVSRGINNACLLETIRACQKTMRRNSFFPYLVEIVTDAGVFQAPDEPDVIHLKVPLDYKTKNHTLFKARALHYACEFSVVPNNAWIVHLDEETQPTSSSIKGLCKFISKCEREKDRRRIGQGCILYHRSWKSYRFLTLADMRRTGDDFGHFFLQHRLGIILFGLHGAFVVCRVDTEKRIGFDVGPHGSITEDAWWSLMALEKGCRFAWVDGFLAEQSTQSVSDLIKQRRRWNYGLMKVAFLSPTRLRYRFSFAFFLVMWFISPFVTPFQVLYVLVIIWHDLPIPMMVRIPTLFIISTQVWTYFIGWVINVREGLDVKWFMIPIWTVVLILLYPVFQMFEIVALFMSFFAGFSESGRGFHVVQKNALTTGKQRTAAEEEKPLLV